MDRGVKSSVIALLVVLAIVIPMMYFILFTGEYAVQKSERNRNQRIVLELVKSGNQSVINELIRLGAIEEIIILPDKNVITLSDGKKIIVEK